MFAPSLQTVLTRRGRCALVVPADVLQAEKCANRYVPGLRKFKLLLGILPLTLSNIMAQWNAAELTDFEPPELKTLIVTLFPDSAQRKQCVHELENR